MSRRRPAVPGRCLYNPGPAAGDAAESEYGRLGTLACLAAYDIHRARVYGRCEETTGPDLRAMTIL
jgi:hypothetical protein